jgi:hypothetical protein
MDVVVFVRCRVVGGRRRIVRVVCGAVSRSSRDMSTVLGARLDVDRIECAAQLCSTSLSGTHHTSAIVVDIVGWRFRHGLSSSNSQCCCFFFHVDHLFFQANYIADVYMTNQATHLAPLRSDQATAVQRIEVRSSLLLLFLLYDCCFDVNTSIAHRLQLLCEQHLAVRRVTTVFIAHHQ